MHRASRVIVAAAAFGSADAATAQGAGSHAGPVDGRPSHAEIWTTPEASHIDNRTETGWSALANRYESALQFVRCAGRIDPAGVVGLIDRPIGHGDEARTMQRFAGRYRVCVGEAGAVAPLLIRAAIAESLLIHQHGLLKQAAARIGVPSVVEGYPIGRIASCQVQTAPVAVSSLFSTRPGSAEERKAADAVLAATPRCGGVAGRMHPTAARLALLDAVTGADPR
ncbi:hypothetical protein G7077_13380 [Sphingomonas piscis]|uniref:Uncharacterized protein n=1 Tax=Sphingomonas piscis TaxID=2714943 RepID=A0A6G7YSM1_9SPHN|nr:hypothetical protein [Sphingomonas piscis]QIK79748.1 hypothetical protein G7077_13380 [Sphingomonas piscis]